MTQAKGKKIIKWRPFERAIRWEASSMGMSKGKELGDMSPTRKGASID